MPPHPALSPTGERIQVRWTAVGNSISTAKLNRVADGYIARHIDVEFQVSLAMSHTASRSCLQAITPYALGGTPWHYD